MQETVMYNCSYIESLVFVIGHLTIWLSGFLFKLYMYIYICVCICVCVRVRVRVHIHI